MHHLSNYGISDRSSYSITHGSDRHHKKRYYKGRNSSDHRKKELSLERIQEVEKFDLEYDGNIADMIKNRRELNRNRNRRLKRNKSGNHVPKINTGTEFENQIEVN